MTWVDAVVLAIARHGGRAHLNRIYDEAAFLKSAEKPPNYERQIQATIEQHSSDSACFRPGAKDLFCSVLGKGNGVWGLRNSSISIGEAMSDMFAKQLFMMTPGLHERMFTHPSYLEAMSSVNHTKRSAGPGWDLLDQIKSRRVLDVAADFKPVT